jgi:hypothetical protein
MPVEVSFKTLMRSMFFCTANLFCFSKIFLRCVSFSSDIVSSFSNTLTSPRASLICEISSFKTLDLLVAIDSFCCASFNAERALTNWLFKSSSVEIEVLSLILEGLLED